jgi:hypothetical protein
MAPAARLASSPRARTLSSSAAPTGEWMVIVPSAEGNAEAWPEPLCRVVVRASGRSGRRLDFDALGPSKPRLDGGEAPLPSRDLEMHLFLASARVYAESAGWVGRPLRSSHRDSSPLR